MRSDKKFKAGKKGSAPSSASVREYWRLGVVVSEPDLRSLNEVFSAFCPDISYNITCKDRLVRTFTDVDSLFNFENPPTKEIVKLEIAGRSAEGGNNRRFRFEIANSLGLGSTYSLAPKGRQIRLRTSQ